MGGADILTFGVSDGGNFGVGGVLTDIVITQVEVLRAAQVPNLVVSDSSGYEDLGILFPISITPTSSLERVWVDIYLPPEMSLPIGTYF